MKLVTYNYPIIDILESSQLKSMYKANTLLGKSDTAADDTVVSDEDQGICGGFLKSGALKVSAIMQGYSQGVQDENGAALKAFEWDTEDKHEIVFRTAMPDNFATSSVDMIEDSVRTALENYTLMEMAKLRGIDPVSYIEKWDDASRQTSAYLCKRDRPIERKYNFY